LKDGKPKEVPTAYTGAVRIQALDEVQQRFGGAASGEALVGLKVSPEPKIQWQNLISLRIDKAVDDQGQKLTQATDPPDGAGNALGGGGAGFGGGWGRAAVFTGVGALHQYLPVRLKKGDKEAKSLKELTGTLTAQVLAEPEIHITVDNILKASG